MRQESTRWFGNIRGKPKVTLMWRQGFDGIVYI